MSLATRTPEDAAAIARLLVPLLLEPTAPHSILVAKCVLMLGKAHQEARILTEDAKPDVREAIGTVVHVAKEMVSEPSVLGALQRIAGQQDLSLGEQEDAVALLQQSLTQQPFEL